MVNRKDELSNTDIDQGWPHQVALPAETTLGEKYFTVYGFRKDLTLCPKGHIFRRSDRWFTVFCFAKREDANVFRAKSGGELMAPEDRPR